MRKSTIFWFVTISTILIICHLLVLPNVNDEFDIFAFLSMWLGGIDCMILLYFGLNFLMYFYEEIVPKVNDYFNE